MGVGLEPKPRRQKAWTHYESGLITKWIDQRIVNEQKSGSMMEAFTAYMSDEQERRTEDMKWRQQQVEQCKGHVENLIQLSEHQQKHNAFANDMLGELRGINASLHDSDGINAPVKRLEASATELADVALLLFDKPIDQLTEDEKRTTRDRIIKVRERHMRRVTK